MPNTSGQCPSDSLLDFPLAIDVLQQGAIACTNAAAFFIDLAHQSAQFAEDWLNARHFILVLDASLRCRSDFLGLLESELLVIDTQPVTIAGQTRTTAHTAAFAGGQVVFDAILGCPPTVDHNGLPLAVQRDDCWSPQEISTQLRRFHPFDRELVLEMIKREACLAQRSYEQRLLAVQLVHDVQAVRDETTSLLTKAEAAAYLRVSPRTIGRYIDRGKLTAVEEGESWRFNLQQLQVLRTANLVTPDTELAD